MKITTFILITVILQVSASTFAQKITLSEKNTPLINVLEKIRLQSGYDFMFSTKVLADANTVNINVKNVELKDALELIFKSQPLTYKIEAQSVSLFRKTPSFLERVMDNITADSRGVIDVKGKVLNENGAPLSGALIKKKSDSRGVTTDASGNFLFKGIDEKDMLIVSYLGYATQEIKVTASPVIYMKPATNALDQVVIQAYGQTSDRLRTGNIATVTAAEIERRPVTNVLTALQGKVPGLEIKASSGHESGNFKVEIRGRKFLDNRQNPDPLYIVDGVPLTVLDFNKSGSAGGGNGFLQGGIDAPTGIQGQSPLFSLNPGDIESVTVLKDADATAIYGSRGGTGVIVITTKKGRVGKTQLDGSFTTGISRVPKFYELMSTQEYVAMRKEALINDKLTQNVFDTPDLMLWDTTRYTDWQKLLYGGTGKRSIAQLNLSGGHNQMTFRLGGNLTKTTGVTTVAGGNQKVSLHSNLTHKSLNNKLNLSFTNFFSQSTVKEVVYLGGMALMTPFAPSIFDSNGKLNYKDWRPVASFPFNDLGNIPYESKTGFFNSQLNIKYDVVKKLQFSANVGYSTNVINQVKVTTIASQDPQFNPTGSSAFGNIQGHRWIVEPQLNYQAGILKGRLEVLAGASMQKVFQEGSSAFGQGFVNDNLLFSISNAPLTSSSNNKLQYSYAAIFARINYNWSDKYILNLSARRDGSSRFGPNKQYGNFASIGAAWIFTESEYFKDHFKWLSLGKLRTSFGSSGSDNIFDYEFLSRWTANRNQVIPYQGVTSYKATKHFNPDLQWQKNTKLEVALQLGFLDDKISLELANYRDRCGNQLLDLPLPLITGFGSVTTNRPAVVENRGYELSARANILESKDFSVATNFNISINSNKLIKFPNLEQSIYATQFVIGKPVDLKNVLHYTGLDPQTGKYTFEDRDQNGEIRGSSSGKLNDLYRKAINVRYFGGFGVDLRYRNVNLNLFFTYFRKPFETSAIFNGVPGNFGNGSGTYNQSVQLLNRWQKPGDQARFARYTTMFDISDNHFFNSDGLYSDASNIRLDNASVSYDVPSRALKRIGISKLSVFARGENLFILTRYNGLDPEATALGVLPRLRSFTGGLNVNF